MGPLEFLAANAVVLFLGAYCAGTLPMVASLSAEQLKAVRGGGGVPARRGPPGA